MAIKIVPPVVRNPSMHVEVGSNSVDITTSALLRCEDIEELMNLVQCALQRAVLRQDGKRPGDIKVTWEVE